IMRHDAVITEGWWKPYGPKIRHGLQSHTKTYTATAVGIVLREGKLRLDERIIDIFPEEAPEHPSENLQKLTIRDVLCMGTGMVDDTPNTEHWLKDFLAHDVVYEPGKAFFYNNAGSTLLAAIVEKRTGERLLDYLKPRLFDLIGIDYDNLRCLNMADGTSLGAGGMFATTEDNLRLMKLYKDGGVWDGVRILDEDFVHDAVTKQNDNATEALHNPTAYDNFVGYGYQLWMCRPEGVYRADGAMGQYTIVIPSEDMIISINETAMGPTNQQRTLDITWDFLKAIHEDTPEDPEAYEHLKDKLESLALPDVHVEPGSPLRNVIDGRGIHIETGKITLQKGFIGLPVGSGITDLRFDCGVLDVMMTYTEDGIENSVVIGTDGERAVNHLNEPEDTMQLLAAHGYFEGEDTFTVHFRWVEACFEYVWRFVFKDEDVTITETWNSMLPEDPDAVPVTGKLEELEIDTIL
ncbi:MAG: serine hydrolase, partial [Solobacterium sp.]|nr:serine hydrolase [Solobacterium sp.]